MVRDTMLWKAEVGETNELDVAAEVAAVAEAGGSVVVCGGLWETCLGGSTLAGSTLSGRPVCLMVVCLMVEL